MGDCRRRPAAERHAVSRKAMRPTAAVKNGVDHLNVEGAAYHSTGHSVAGCCTLSAEKTGMRVQHPAIDTSLSIFRAPSTLYPTD